MKRKRLFLFGGIALLLAALGIAAFLVYTGRIPLNRPSPSRYPVRGVDVSSYQGEIDWPALASQNIRFAFIKATEGSSFTDGRFAYNWEEAPKAGLRVGAYHFFSYDSPGETQAAHFIETVPAIDGMLPPVVDVEFYGDKEKNPPPAEEVRASLSAMLNALKKHYGMKPILYATRKSYELYIQGAFEENDIWIRSVITEPSIDRPWTFWQYSNRTVLDGYRGKERYIDMNVFQGTEEEFARYPGE